MGSIDEILATIRRLPLQERRRLIKQAANEVGVAERARTRCVDELLTARLTPPPGVGPVRMKAMDRAIAEGASGSRNASAATLLGLMADEPDLVDQGCSFAYEAHRTAHLRAVDE